MVDVGYNLVVDIEALKWTYFAQRSDFKEEYKNKFSINDIPTDIKFFGKDFKLSSIIEYLE